MDKLQKILKLKNKKNAPKDSSWVFKALIEVMKAGKRNNTNTRNRPKMLRPILFFKNPKLGREHLHPYFFYLKYSYTKRKILHRTNLYESSNLRSFLKLVVTDEPNPHAFSDFTTSIHNSVYNKLNIVLAHYILTFFKKKVIHSVPFFSNYHTKYFFRGFNSLLINRLSVSDHEHISFFKETKLLLNLTSIRNRVSSTNTLLNSKYAFKKQSITNFMHLLKKLILYLNAFQERKSKNLDIIFSRILGSFLVQFQFFIGIPRLYFKQSLKEIVYDKLFNIDQKIKKRLLGSGIDSSIEGIVQNSELSKKKFIVSFISTIDNVPYKQRISSYRSITKSRSLSDSKIINYIQKINKTFLPAFLDHLGLSYQKINFFTYYKPAFKLSIQNNILLKILNFYRFFKKVKKNLHEFSRIGKTVKQSNLRNRLVNKKIVLKLKEYKIFLLELLNSDSFFQNEFSNLSRLIHLVSLLHVNFSSIKRGAFNKIRFLRRKSQKVKQFGRYYDCFHIKWSKRSYFKKINFEKRKKIELDKVGHEENLLDESKLLRAAKKRIHFNKNSNLAFFESFFISRNKYLVQLRNHLIKNGNKYNSNKNVSRLLANIKYKYKICPIKIVRYIISQHFQSTVINIVDLKKKREGASKPIFIVKMLSTKKIFFYMITNFLDENKLFNDANSIKFSYKEFGNKTSKFFFFLERYIDFVLNTKSSDKNLLPFFQKKKIVEDYCYNKRHYISVGSHHKKSSRKYGSSRDHSFIRAI